MSAEPSSTDEAGHPPAKDPPQALSARIDQTRRAIDETPASRAFVRRLMRCFLPRTAQADTGTVVEKLVLLFSKLAVAISMIGLLVGGWISIERYQARMAEKAGADTVTRRGGQADTAQQRKQRPASGSAASSGQVDALKPDAKGSTH